MINNQSGTVRYFLIWRQMCAMALSFMRPYWSIVRSIPGILLIEKWQPWCDAGEKLDFRHMKLELHVGFVASVCIPTTPFTSSWFLYMTDGFCLPPLIYFVVLMTLYSNLVLNQSNQESPLHDHHTIVVLTCLNYIVLSHIIAESLLHYYTHTHIYIYI